MGMCMPDSRSTSSGRELEPTFRAHQHRPEAFTGVLAGLAALQQELDQI